MESELMAKEKQQECFIIMPISEPDGYEKDHFRHVYDDLIAPACETAGYKPIRSDDVLETNLIHLDVLKSILETPMAICDLSTRNPNVLFELGLRQAFDKPVVLIQEKGTPTIFDIAPLRFTEYRKERIYHEAIEDQSKIAEAIEATAKAAKQDKGVNSIIKLLSLTSPATFQDFGGDENSPMMQVVMAEMGALRRELRDSIRGIERNSNRSTQRGRGEFFEARHELDRLRSHLKDAEETMHSGDIIHTRTRLQRVVNLCEETLKRSVGRDNVMPHNREELMGIRNEFESLRDRASMLLEHMSRNDANS
jgi:hypothetical protein